ncbi:M56 family metallopeptidase [Flavobacterium sp.]|uniref:M56 family metallopeptidase n=1 Tax=Flavobacterium sp. TaxID=239 RepID=UPI002608ADB9|nr:M56 family metallopeptidase [Flavobacterium sp.]
METLFIYFLKASALLAVYFLAYHFLLRKETFFTTNRWFLLAGMITSGVMPLLFIKKIVTVEEPTVSVDELVQYAGNSAVQIQEAATIDWFQVTAFGYAIIATLLFAKILMHLASLFKLLHKKEVVKKERFSLVDLNENIAPFSFFNYIVYNSSYYTQDELNSILLHEKIHSQERHSIDVMLAKLFCIVFWFNPFMWLYKKAINQNLEYIADQKAVQHIEDKRVYQKALLKVVTHQNCLSITSHFYQSLIKKRIVMLNKNQSKQRNAWKYALVIPALVAFVIFFQVKVIAQEKNPIQNEKPLEVIDFVWTKDATTEELKDDAQRAKELNIKLSFSKIKRNANGEITAIKIEFKGDKGQKGTTYVDGDEPIKPIHFSKYDNEMGFGTANRDRVVFTDREDGDQDGFEVEDAIAAIPDMPELPDMPEVDEVAEAPEAPELPEMQGIPNPPSPPTAPRHPRKGDKHVIIKQNGDKKEVWVNGEKVSEDRVGYYEIPDININVDTKGPKGPKGPKNMRRIVVNNDFQMINEGDDDEDIVIVTKGKNGTRTERIEKSVIRRRAMQDAKADMERARPEMERARIEIERAKPEMERARREMERARPEMERARREIERSKPEIEQARQEIERAKAEIEKEKAEIEKAKADMEREKAELKKRKS